MKNYTREEIVEIACEKLIAELDKVNCEFSNDNGGRSKFTAFVDFESDDYPTDSEIIAVYYR